ncbi:hypothetical protein Tsubulata_042006 [Turnera subulata]|uniref:Beta-glucosidase n=1 Tax=Turnera subulata TaxID=218843 RepID=A0A9Q0F6X3_9ROSI|nr:hypothetical protein Tsubulata_042006 [Turnera subulata]
MKSALCDPLPLGYSSGTAGQIRDDFRDYAELCFERFGDRVKHWITLSEPCRYAVWGHDYGENAPGRCSSWKNRACKAGNSAVEPYIVAHHQLLSHAAAVDVYRKKYKGQQKGLVGTTLLTWWTEPYSSKTADIDAAKRVLDFMFLDPLTYGDYPRTMREYVKNRLPMFTQTQSEMLRGSLDFLGLNYYSSRYVKNVESQDPERISREFGRPVHCPSAGVEWLRIAPFGIRYLLNYTKDNYKNPPIFITENGNTTLALKASWHGRLQTPSNGRAEESDKNPQEFTRVAEGKALGRFCITELPSLFGLVVLSDFPKDFYFGSATSSYQVEGAANKSGRGPNRIRDGRNGDVAVDFYNRYKEDLKMMKDTGLNAIRFSISWSRIIPHDFRDYAELCFKRFGDRVKYWITLNEPWAYATFGYDNGEFAPGRCSSWVSRACKGGNSAVEPYIASHHLLLSHAAAVEVYRQKYKVHGSFNLWRLSTDNEKLSQGQAAKLRGSLDFLGLNYYSARFVTNVETEDPERISFKADLHLDLLYENIYRRTAGLEWLRVAPFGIRYLLNYTKDTYRNPTIYITENGVAHDDSDLLGDIMHDTRRIDYYDTHIGNAILHGRLWTISNGQVDILRGLVSPTLTTKTI